jgi:peptide/nickel transport system permease protein
LVSRTGIRLVQMLNYRLDAAHLLMPVLALSWAPAALLAQSTATTLGTIYDRDYVRAARGRGIDGWRLFLRHVLPVSAGPTVAAVAVALQVTLATIPLLEYLFGWPGLGMLLLRALLGQDLAGLALLAALFAVVFIGLGMLADALRMPRAGVAGAAKAP